MSLWSALQGREDANRPVFAEYHALGSSDASYLYRRHEHKLIHHVGRESQLFNLAVDPEEEFDLAGSMEHRDLLTRLETELRGIVAPEAADAEAKAAQRARIRELGGAEAVLARRSGFVYSPPPGKDWKRF